MKKTIPQPSTGPVLNAETDGLPLHGLAPSEALTQIGASDKQRLIQLDLLRGIAILLVFGRHILVGPNEQGVFRPFASLWFRFGWTGVDLFFVLSGFLVGGLLFKELRLTSKLDVKRFIIRRGFKIWPGYFVYLFILMGLQKLHVIHDASYLLPNFLHVQNYLGTSRLHTWSLAVEEHFYLLLPLLLLFITFRSGSPQQSLKSVPYVCLAGMIICTSLRFTNLAHPYNLLKDIFPTHLRIDGLLFGVLLSYLYHFKQEWLSRVGQKYQILFIVGFALISPMLFLSMEQPFVYTIGFTLLYLGFGCLLLALLYAPTETGLFSRLIKSRPVRALSVIGFYSYSIYLWHLDLALKPLDIFWKRGHVSFIPIGDHWIIDVLIGVPLAFAAGLFFGKLVEIPALALRDRLYPSRAIGEGASSTADRIKSVMA